ncbi:MAG: phytanoyl-CoA dioxygenase family protein [Candidatus Omnitrophica bacterium]|nr:phytanoyl-CoA dioxygenase family protein [Candidatus Omnitrophota bacterium]
MSLTSHGHPVPPEILGPLNESRFSPGAASSLRDRMEEDGYLLLRGLLNRDEVLRARREIFERLAEVGEVSTEHPVEEGVATGTSQRADLVSDLSQFWQQVSELPSLRRVTHSGPMIEFFETFLGGPVRPFDFLWLRTMAPGKASGFHYDHVYMNRGTDHLFSCWTPLGDVKREEGTLLVMEGSHHFQDLISKYRGVDVDRDSSVNGTITLDPVAMAQERGVRLLSGDFQAGDILILDMFCLHGSLDNNSSQGKIRLSCDTRYQLASEPIDDRWIGANPEGHGGGYGGLSAAQPLTAPPIFR